MKNIEKTGKNARSGEFPLRALRNQLNLRKNYV